MEVEDAPEAFVEGRLPRSHGGGELSAEHRQGGERVKQRSFEGRKTTGKVKVPPAFV